MILYRTQPKNPQENVIVNIGTKQKLISDIRECVSRYKNKDTSHTDIITMVTDASIVDGMIASSGYDNILVLPSFRDDQYTRLTGPDFIPEKSVGDHILPIVHERSGSQGNIYVAQPKVGNFFNELYEKCEINLIDIDEWFVVDSIAFRIKTNIKFDAVVLLGNESYKKGKFKACDVKKKFAKYCTEDFDLIDVYRGSCRQLTGPKRNIDREVDRLIRTINNTTRIYHTNVNINEEFLDDVGIVGNSDRLLYEHLLTNIQTIKDWYSVY